MSVRAILVSMMVLVKIKSTHSPAVAPQEFMVSTGLCVKVSLLMYFRYFYTIVGRRREE